MMHTGSHAQPPVMTAAEFNRRRQGPLKVSLQGNVGSGHGSSCGRNCQGSGPPAPGRKLGFCKGCDYEDMCMAFLTGIPVGTERPGTVGVPPLTTKPFPTPQGPLKVKKKKVPPPPTGGSPAGCGGLGQPAC